MARPAPVVRLAGTDDKRSFDRFRAEVARRNLEDWLPERRSTVLDLSRRSPHLLRSMVERGHSVVHAEPAQPSRPVGDSVGGRLRQVAADPLRPDWLEAGSVDLVVAEGGTLSAALAAELTLERLHRVLRPGGRLLAAVDSLVAGLARLADLGRWAELADVPAADVVLIPTADGGATRCFWPEELDGMFTGAGFEVEWIRPRTVLTEETVDRALRQDAGQLESLVSTELALEVKRQGESIGAELVVSARTRPAAGS